MRAPTSRLTSLVAAVAVTAGLFVSSGTASAALGASIDSVDRDGCDLTVNVTVEDAGTYYLLVYDDGDTLASIAFTPAAGATVGVPYTIVSNVSAGSPGLGLEINSQADGEGIAFDGLDPYDFPNSGDISQACAVAATSTTTTSTTSTTTAPSTTSTTEAPSTTAAPTTTTAVVSGTGATPAAAPANAVAGSPSYTG